MLFKNYTVNYQHRGLLSITQKSQWTINEWDELKLFIKAQTYNWICEKENLWSIDDKFNVIGEDQNGALFLAKFVVDQACWHGYPVSSKRHGDRPPSDTLKSWVEQKIITKSTASKIAQGKL